MAGKRKYTRRKRKTSKRTTYRRKKTNADLTLVRNPKIGGFPKALFTKLKYVHSGALNPDVGGLNDIDVFRANGMFDPDATGAGHQPRGFDQWMAIYDHYYVKRSKITVNYHNGDGSLEAMVGIALRDDTPTETDPNDYMEQDSKYKLIGRVGSSDCHATLTKYFDWRKTHGSSYTDDQNKGSSTGDPAEQALFHVWAGSPWGGNVTNIYVNITIEYQVLFTELKDLTSS